MQAQDYRKCPDCAAEIEPDEDGDFPDECPNCEWDGDFVTPEHVKFGDVYSSLDGTGGTMDVLANAVSAAQEAGHHLETTEDRMADAGFQLGQAFEKMHEHGPDDVDAEEVLDHIEAAQSMMADMHRGMPDDAREFEIPDYVDSGVYDTLDGFAEYVLWDIIGIRLDAEEWAELAE